MNTNQVDKENAEPQGQNKKDKPKTSETNQKPRNSRIEIKRILQQNNNDLNDVNPNKKQQNTVEVEKTNMEFDPRLILNLDELGSENQSAKNLNIIEDNDKKAAEPEKEDCVEDKANQANDTDKIDSKNYEFTRTKLSFIIIKYG